MKPLSRRPVNKSSSVRNFNRTDSRTKAINMPGYGFRGGIRL